MADNRPIGVFDSGLGGLTVVREIMRLMPNEDIIYFGDTARVPYGGRSSSTVIKYATEDAELLLRHNVKLIVAACGTVSSVATELGKDLPVPYFGVVAPSAEYAAKVTKNGKIGVIGTRATIKSTAHKNAILKIKPQAEVFNNACPLFVPLVEEGWYKAEDSVVKGTVSRDMEPLKQAGVDTLILGCTHYPILKDAISAEMGEGVQLVNMGKAAAEMLKEYIISASLCNGSETKGRVKYLVSDKTEAFGAVASVLMGEDIGLNDVELVKVTL